MSKRLKRKLRLQSTDKLAMLGAAAATAAAGVWLYKRWQIPVKEHSHEVPAVAPVEEALSAEDWHGKRGIQLPEQGAGDVFHRLYRVDIRASRETPESLMAKIQANPHTFTAPELANFEKTEGPSGEMQVGDEYYISILGPWDGPVRVIETEPDHFTLITLDKHLEAGQICFRAMRNPDDSDMIRFEIESWARSRDQAVALAYEQAGIAKTAQKAMWVWFCKRAAEESGGEMAGEIDVLTERAPFRGEIIPNE